MNTFWWLIFNYTLKLYVNTIIENHYDIEYAKAEYKEAKKGFRKELERNNDEGILALGDWVNTLNNALEGTEAGVRIIAHGSISKVVLEVIKVWEDLEIREETKLFPFDIDKLIEEDYAGNEVMTNLQISHKSRTMEYNHLMKRFEFISNNIKKYEPNLPSELKSLIIELFSEFNEKFGDFPSPVKKD